MESQTQNKQLTPKPIFSMAQKAMKDMETLIQKMRQARSNVNQLVQSAPSDKPVFLFQASETAEAKFRQAKTDLNLWMQKHFRGGEEWSDQPEQNDHCEPDEKFNLGHCHQIEMVEGGCLHSCGQMSCRHYSTEVVGNHPKFNNGNDERGVVLAGGITWGCPNVDCRHLRFGKGEDEVDFLSRHAQLQTRTCACESGETEFSQTNSVDADVQGSDEFFEEFCGDVYDIALDEIDHDARIRAFARMDANDYLQAPRGNRFHDVIVDAYRRRNSWTSPEWWVETAYPNC